MNSTITSVMMQEHKKLDAQLEEFEKTTLTDLNKAKELFNQFRWNLEKHFFVEEKVVFSALTETDNDDTFRLLKEHKDILWHLKNIEETLSKHLEPDISGLASDLKHHAHFEDLSFYPKLDENLDDKLKELVIDRANEIIRE